LFLQEFEVISSFQAHADYLLKCVICPDKSIVATSSADHSIKLWDPSNSFSLIRSLKQHTRWVWDVTFSADSSFMVTASSDQSAKLWYDQMMSCSDVLFFENFFFRDLRSGEVIRNYNGHSLAVTSVALNDTSG
jgi:G protein beta subunit-like protein